MNLFSIKSVIPYVHEMKKLFERKIPRCHLQNSSVTEEKEGKGEDLDNDLLEEVEEDDEEDERIEVCVCCLLEGQQILVWYCVFKGIYLFFMTCLPP